VSSQDWIYKGFTRAAGHHTFSMLSATAGLWLVRVPLTLIAAHVLRLDAVWVWFAIVLDQIVRLSMDYAYARHKKLFQEA
jgi:Na+-driven multidrug efflux pump